MPSVWLIADPHFSHWGVCKFLGPDGVTKLRPWDHPNDMDEALVTNWNRKVAPKDKIYVLGDVVMKSKQLEIMERLHGDKVLIKGNHDIFPMEAYRKYFRDIRAYHVMSGMILSHIPIHEGSIGRFGANIHGHLHGHRVMKDGVIDPRYFCVSVEHINFEPILFEEVKKRVVKQGGNDNFNQFGEAAI